MPRSCRSSRNSRHAIWARCASSPARSQRPRRTPTRITPGATNTNTPAAPKAMPTVAQPAPRFRPEVWDSSRYSASATIAAAATTSATLVRLTGRRRLAPSGTWPDSTRCAGGATIAMTAHARAMAASMARTTAAHGVPADLADRPAPDPPPAPTNLLAWPPAVGGALVGPTDDPVAPELAVGPVIPVPVPLW